MQLIPSATALAATALLLAGQTLAGCGMGPFNKQKQLAGLMSLGACTSDTRDFFICPKTNAVVTHTKRRVSLLASGADATVMVSCGSSVFVYHCTAYDVGSFEMGACDTDTFSVLSIEE
ncbi:hypothetical protein E4U41_004173 [Claviceps citrina]|nr:hypothetical protein E4U41_004173 [Claviceps citrina]